MEDDRKLQAPLSGNQSSMYPSNIRNPSPSQQLPSSLPSRTTLSPDVKVAATQTSSHDQNEENEKGPQLVGGEVEVSPTSDQKANKGKRRKSILQKLGLVSSPPKEEDESTPSHLMPTPAGRPRRNSAGLLGIIFGKGVVSPSKSDRRSEERKATTESEPKESQTPDILQKWVEDSESSQIRSTEDTKERNDHHSETHLTEAEGDGNNHASSSTTNDDPMSVINGCHTALYDVVKSASAAIKTLRKLRAKDQSTGQMMTAAQHRLKVAVELVETERTYVDGLNALEQHIIQPLRRACGKQGESKKIISPSHIDQIFSQLEQIITLNGNFVQDLHKRLVIWETESIEDEDRCIGDVLLEWLPVFQLYGTYCANYESSNKLVNSLLRSKPRFQAFLEEQPVSLMSTLITPIQRVPRYELLISELIKHTPESHKDRSDLVKAAELVQKVASAINLAVKREESRQTIHHLESLFGKNPKWANDRRLFLRWGKLTKQCKSCEKEYQFFLFSDLLAYASYSTVHNLNLHRELTIDQVFSVENLPFDRVNDSFQHAYKIKINSREKSFIVYCRNHAEKSDWLKSFEEAVGYLKAEQEKVAFADVKLREIGNGIYKAMTLSKQRRASAAVFMRPFDDVTNCKLCTIAFSITTRRHHCKICGEVVCADCSKRRLPGGGRCCDTCAGPVPVQTSPRSSGRRVRSKSVLDFPGAKVKVAVDFIRRARASMPVIDFPTFASSDMVNGTSLCPPVPDSSHDPDQQNPVNDQPNQGNADQLTPEEIGPSESILQQIEEETSTNNLDRQAGSEFTPGIDAPEKETLCSEPEAETAAAETETVAFETDTLHTGETGSSPEHALSSSQPEATTVPSPANDLDAPITTSIPSPSRSPNLSSGSTATSHR